ncbi:hypothetical protein OHB01_14810 [Microbispora hainanensis]|uniref:Uncharacterized protein n=1 Tax=Microbispora hainanensis TaxID=568844 RepID=A0ABZ1SHK5_9ACTN|nr:MULTISPECIES: hypothetical protein [Microbispora]
MTVPMEAARRVADAVLYEGYLLYPYRASAAKNRMRWQFGVLVPPNYPGEPSGSATECLLEAPGDARIDVRLRFLHVRSRTVEREEDDGYWPVPKLTVGGRDYLSFDEATEREARTTVSLARVTARPCTIEVQVLADRVIENIAGPGGERTGRIVCEHQPLDAELRISAERLPGPYGLVRLRVEVENTSHWERADAPREEALRRSLVAAHLLIGVSGGAFVSLLDPPMWAEAAARQCRNENTWPVLVGEAGRRDVVLSSPIILYDHPAIAPESPGDLFDSTEIDELLTLRTLTLTEEEKREARVTDPRAAEILERAADLPPELLERLHGAIRHLEVPARTTPDDESVTVGGVRIARGSRVRLRPGHRRADAQDMFLAGRTALVEAVFLDVDGVRHLAVTLEDDPGSDLQREQRRFFYFAPDEVEPL